ncbi:MAG TPA: hypothetical protein VHE35_16460, partial [Kofleriaceae bacterium]|nr:hypothetical protein [Kofleriaceae bacterium]
MRTRTALAGGALAAALLLAACGDNVPAPVPDCAGLGPPITGVSLEAAREAHRRAALRQRLRLREAIEPGYLRRVTAPLVDEEELARGNYCAADLYEVGRLLFEHPFGFADGLAAGPPADGKTPFRRVQSGRTGGPETTACTSCHWRNGPGGAGGLPDDTFLLGDGD